MTSEPTEELEAGPPPFDAHAVGRVVPKVEIEEFELLGGHFQRRDDGPLAPSAPAEEIPDEMGISVEWQVDTDRGLLGCALTFATDFPDTDEPPYEVIARFRLVYRLLDDEPPEEDDCEQFVYWNAVFNAWPYWREFLSSTLNRTQLPSVLAPVMRMPRSGDTTVVPTP